MSDGPAKMDRERAAAFVEKCKACFQVLKASDPDFEMKLAANVILVDAEIKEGGGEPFDAAFRLVRAATENDANRVWVVMAALHMTTLDIVKEKVGAKQC